MHSILAVMQIMLRMLSSASTLSRILLAQVITASSDGTVRVWDAKTCESLLVVKPPQTASGSEPSVHSVWAHPQNADQVFVCPRSSTVFLMTLKGQVWAPYAVSPTNSYLVQVLTVSQLCLSCLS